MFDSLLGRKFTSKCKHSIKCVNARIVPIMRKKQAMLRFLQKDVADLIANGLDINAFGRIDALIVEINHAFCYDMIEQYCECILKQLPSLQKQRECSQEAMEAVSTLIYAAARFPDLPELCDLRRVFTERYGSHMESSVNSEFVQKIQKKSFPINKKLQLMQQIARDLSVTWDFKAFEQKMSLPSAPSAPNKAVPFCNGNKEPSHMSNGRKGIPICNGNDEPQRTSNGRKEADTNVRNEETPSKGMFEAAPMSIAQKLVQTEPKVIHAVSSISNGYLHDRAKKTKKVFADEPDSVKPRCKDAAVPPPYVKPKDDPNEWQKDQLSEGICNRSAWAQEGQGPIGLAREAVEAVKSRDYRERLEPKGSKIESNAVEHYENGYINDRSPKATEDGLDPRRQERHHIRPVNSNNDKPVYMIPPYIKPKVDNLSAHSQSSDFEDKVHPERKLLGDEKPKPFSVRRKHTAQPAVASKVDSGIDDAKLVSQTPSGRGIQGCNRSSAAYVDEEQKIRDWNEVDGDADYGRHVNRTPSGRRLHRGRRSSGTTYDGDCDEEERIMDRLLMRYGKKGMEIACSEKRTSIVDAGKGVEHQTDAKIHHGARRSVNPLGRAVSIQLEPEPVSQMKVSNGPYRASSMRADMLGTNGGHLHPRLPDYNELAAPFITSRKK